MFGQQSLQPKVLQKCYSSVVTLWLYHWNGFPSRFSKVYGQGHRYWSRICFTPAILVCALLYSKSKYGKLTVITVTYATALTAVVTWLDSITNRWNNIPTSHWVEGHISVMWANVNNSSYIYWFNTKTFLSGISLSRKSPTLGQISNIFYDSWHIPRQF